MDIFRYFPKPNKTVMIVKTAELLEEACEIFRGTGITNDFQGDRHLGAVIGNQDFKEKYVRKKINNWNKDVEQLSTIAQDEPQLALNACMRCPLNKGPTHIVLWMRWSFVQRTIINVVHLFQVRFVGGIGILNRAKTEEFKLKVPPP